MAGSGAPRAVTTAPFVRFATFAQGEVKSLDKKRLRYPVIVEGKYDKNTLSQIFDATIVPIGGFSVFNSKEKQALIRKLSADGIILLTDSDGGGKQIRSFVQGIVPKEKLYNAYVPRIEGKEKRKAKPSKAGLLGVEGMSRDVLEVALAPFVEDGERVEENNAKERKMITKVDFFADGLTGCNNATEARRVLAEHFDLPGDMTANALLEALNIITDYEGYKRAVSELF